MPTEKEYWISDYLVSVVKLFPVVDLLLVVHPTYSPVSGSQNTRLQPRAFCGRQESELHEGNLTSGR